MLNPYAFYGKIHGRKMVLMLRGGKIPCSCWAFVSLLLGSFSSSELSELNNFFFWFNPSCLHGIPTYSWDPGLYFSIGKSMGKSHRLCQPKASERCRFYPRLWGNLAAGWWKTSRCDPSAGCRWPFRSMNDDIQKHGKLQRELQEL